MAEPTKMTIAAAYTLNQVIAEVLYDENKQERDIPFNVKYKLIRAKDILEKDVVFFETERNNLIKSLGADDGQGNIKVTDENEPKFRAELEKLLRIEVEHNLLKMKPEDMDNFDGINLSVQQMALLVSALVDDPELMSDLQKPIDKDAIFTGDAETAEPVTE